jgi:hypothetical protein
MIVWNRLIEAKLVKQLSLALVAPSSSAPVANRARKTESRLPLVFNGLLQHYLPQPDMAGFAILLRHTPLSPLCSFEVLYP